VNGTAGGLRLDRFLCNARLWRHRTDAAKAVEGGAVRLNSARVLKPGHVVRVGDVLTLALRGGVRVIRILSLPERRGAAALAPSWYEEIAPPLEPLATRTYDPAERQSVTGFSKTDMAEG
jgi:ribosome-associated heat shock protein Hsp15